MGQPDRTQAPKTQQTDASENTLDGQNASSVPLRGPERSSTSKPIAADQVERPSICRATGPRTPQGKEKSKLNALKHGLLSKAVLLKGESRAEYQALLNGLQDDLQPQGKLETVLVENLTALFWRKRRLFQAENAAISEKMEFTKRDFSLKRHMEAWDC